MNYKREIRLDWNILSIYFIQNGDLSLVLAHVEYYTESVMVYDNQIQDIKLELHKYINTKQRIMQSWCSRDLTQPCCL